MKPAWSHHWKTLLAAMTLLFLAACMDDQDNLNRYIAEVKARPAAPIPPIPAVQTYVPYKYEGLAGRDPFRMSTSEGADEAVVGAAGNGPRPDLQRTREYLERFDLDTLTMVGTFAKESSNWVLIRDPDRVVHRVAVGNYMGKNHGKVVTIKPNTVELSEFIADGVGGWMVRPASMALGGN